MQDGRNIALAWIGAAALALATVCGLIVVAVAFDLWPHAWPAAGLALKASALGGAAFAAIAVFVQWQQRCRVRDLLRRNRELIDQGAVQVEQMREQLAQTQRIQAELVESQRTAQAAAMAKDEFLATMSHEIRTPLNGIVPMLDMLQGSGLRREQSEMVATAYTSARQLLRIVDDILDYSKLEASKLELETIGINLRELLGLVVRLMEKAAEGKNLNLLLHIDPGLRLAVRGDPTRLRQVLTNLVSNAIKFTERGSVTLSASRAGETATQHIVRFEVRDTGIGVPAESAQRLFRAFSQADASTTRLYGGTGLGLAISQRIVRLMGGHIGFDSTPGQGAVFWFEVPLLKAVGDMAHGSVDLSNARVLLLCSEPVLQRRLRFAVNNWAAAAVLVESTQEALQRLREAQAAGPGKAFDLLVADLASVRTTAIALHRNIRRGTTFDALRIAYLRGEEAVPGELVDPGRAMIVPRSSDDAQLRVALSALLTPPGEPGAEPASPVLDDATALDRPAADRPAERLRGRVLLVEDNPVNRLVAKKLLNVLGLDCTDVENGKQAIEHMAEESYDAVLMDCQMPVMDGYGATRLWREHEQALGAKRRLPIIAMTANAMAGDRHKCLAAGMDDYLAKPVSRAQLVQTLARWIPQSPVAESGLRADVQNHAGAGSGAVPMPVPPLATQVIRGPAIESAVISELRAVMGDDFRTLVQVFLDDAPRRVEQLQQAAAVGDIAGLVEPAHALKSASANVGAIEVSNIARTIEHAARSGELRSPGVRAAHLAQEMQRATEELRGLL